MEYLLLLGAIIVVNLLPAFAPPTWAVLVFFLTQYDMHTTVVIVLGVLAATFGRWILSLYSSFVARRVFSKEQEENVSYISKRLGNTKITNFLFTVLYCLTPLSSAALFIAAGAINMYKPVLLAGFFVGRLISYTILVLSANSVLDTISDVTEQGEFTLLGILLSILAFLTMVLFICLDWRALLEHRKVRFQWKIFAFQK